MELEIVAGGQIFRRDFIPTSYLEILSILPNFLEKFLRFLAREPLLTFNRLYYITIRINFYSMPICLFL